MHSSFVRLSDQFQSTHPLRGATIEQINFALGELDFNPRTPCGVRHTSWPTPTTCSNFNPRTPCGVRLDGHIPFSGLRHFNPRTPCGVRLPITSVSTSASANFNPRTPCGVRLIFFASPQKMIAFQSTHPLRGATVAPAAQLHGLVGISIHAPLAGCDAAVHRNLLPLAISIHAPLAGCDTNAARSTSVSRTHFNPRTPCGVRLGLRAGP